MKRHFQLAGRALTAAGLLLPAMAVVTGCRATLPMDLTAAGRISMSAIRDISAAISIGTGASRAKASFSASPCNPTESRCAITTHRHDDGSRTRATIGENPPSVTGSARPASTSSWP